MATKWKEFTVAEIADRVAMGPFGSDIKTDNFVPSGVPVIRGANLTEGRFRSDDLVFLTEEKADELANANAFPKDIVFTHRGTLGQVGILPSRPYRRYVISQSQMKLACNVKLADPDFVYYYFKSPAGQHAILRNTSQTGVPAISRPVTSLKAIRIPIPPLPEQKAIASILCALDDKIELNRRMNQTIEAMAQALFKSRFIDPTGGGLPKGWRAGSILEIAKLLSGGTPKTERNEYWNGDIPWASAKDVSQCGQTFLVATERTITQRGLAESATQLIPAFCTVVVARGATTGRMVLFGREMAMNQTCYALASTTETPLTLYCMLQHEMEYLVQKAHGSVFDTITTSTFATSKMTLPPTPVLGEFEDHVAPLFRLLRANTIECRTLAELRDTLLPKLLSGELRAPAAEKLVEAHA